MNYSLPFLLDEDISLVCDMLIHALEKECNARRWDEWRAFAPIAAFMGKAVAFEQFGKRNPHETASDNDINDIRRRFNL